MKLDWNNVYVFVMCGAFDKHIGLALQLIATQRV